MIENNEMQLASSSAQMEEDERVEQLTKFFKVVILYFACPTMLVMAVTDKVYQESSVDMMLAMRLLGSFLMAVFCFITIRQKTLRSTQIWATLTGSCAYLAIHFMYYYRGDAQSHFIYALMPALVIVATGLRLTWSFYFLNCALIYIPTVVIGFIIGHGNPGPLFLVDITNWILVWSFCTSGRWFFEKIYEQERLLRIALRNETKERETLLSQAINDLITGNQVSEILVAKMPNLVRQWETLTLKLQDYKKTEAEISISKRLAEQARQVAHDIRSPLSALSLMTESLNEMSEEKRLIVKSASARINDIANVLLLRGTRDISFDQEIEGRGHRNETLMLPAILDQLASEKRAQFRKLANVQIDTDLHESFGAFVLGKRIEVGRLLSNLINNAIESLSESGKVLVSIRMQPDTVNLCIEDNGVGIPSDILNKVGQKGFSYGKDGEQSGAGLGVYHAKTVIRDMGGKFEIKSAEGTGTRIEITLPKAKAPDWFLQQINLESVEQVVVMDDDQSIHHLWKSRFDGLLNSGALSSIKHFASPIDFMEYAKSLPTHRKCLFLIDFEFLQHAETGLDLVRSLGIEKETVLVTSHWDEIMVRSQCEAHQIKLLPKSLVGFIPIRSGAIELSVSRP